MTKKAGPKRLMMTSERSWKVGDTIHFLHNLDYDTYFELGHMYGALEYVDLIYADMIYDDLDFDRWLPRCHEYLKDTGSIFIQTDQRSVAPLKLYLDGLFGANNFVNWIIWPYDWGGRPKHAFGRKHDDILWYAKTRDYKFFAENVQIPKKTTGIGFNPSGRTTKTPTDVWSDIGNFHTMSTERVSGVEWQKPERLVQRIVEAVTEEGDTVFDPFAGSGTTIAVCAKLGRNSVGCEINKSIWERAVERIDNAVSKL